MTTLTYHRNLIGIFSLTLISGIGICAGQTNLEKCPDFNPAEDVSLESLHGVWYILAMGPWDHSSNAADEESSPPDSDCIVETYWADDTTPNDTVNFLFKQRLDGVTQYSKGSIDKVKKFQTKNTWEFIIHGTAMPVTFVATDAGASWTFGYVCTDENPGTNSAVLAWFISSRSPYLDSKIYQNLIKRMQLISPKLQPHDLVAIGQTNCYSEFTTTSKDKHEKTGKNKGKCTKEKGKNRVDNEL